MDRDSLRNLLRRRPFKPFRLHVDDGAAYDVWHPDMLLVSRTEAVVGLPPATAPESDDAERFAWIDLGHISRIEPLEQLATG